MRCDLSSRVALSCEGALTASLSRLRRRQSQARSAAARSAPATTFSNNSRGSSSSLLPVHLPAAPLPAAGLLPSRVPDTVIDFVNPSLLPLQRNLVGRHRDQGSGCPRGQAETDGGSK